MQLVYRGRFCYSIDMKKSELLFSFLLLPFDAIAILAAFAAAYLLRVKVDIIPAYTNVMLADYLQSGLMLLPVWILFFALAGMYQIGRYRNVLSLIYRIFMFSSAAILILIVFIFLNKITFFSRLILVYTWVLSIIFLFLARFIIESIRAYLFRYNVGVRRVVCIGANATAQKIIYESNRNTSLGMKVVGVIDGDNRNKEFKIIGKVDDLEKILTSEKIDEVILTDMSLAESKISEIILTCSAHDVSFRFVPNIFYLLTSNISTSQIAGMPMMEIRGTQLDGWGRVIKRVLDIISSLIFLILSLPFSIIIVVAIKLTSPGPIFYSHDRIGRDDRRFKLYKFRSMEYTKCDYSDNGNKWTKNNDPRITPLGKIIRKTNLDEIPQFYNVLIGNMSIIGPRPEQPKFVEKFQKQIPQYFRRHRVKSGITGWAQVNGLKGDTSIEERVRYDIYYIENWSIWFDLKVFLLTISLIIKEIFGGKYEYRPRP